MEDILNYDKRKQLYQFLIDKFGFTKIEEQYDPSLFGNFYIKLEYDSFWLTYVNDRSFLTVTITSHLDADNTYDLSFVRDYIYDPANINNGAPIDNYQRIQILNIFIQKDFGLIVDLFSKQNYENTKHKIDELLKRQFYRQYEKKLSPLS